MKNLLFCFPFLMVFVQCTLSAKQEAALNSSLAKYIHARNDCELVGLVGFTYPELVKQYKDAGDSLFQYKFNCEENPEYYYAIQNATLRSTVKENNEIQVLYEFDGYGEKEDEYKKRNFELIAISENNGENWFFIPMTDYKNDTLCKGLTRRIE